MNGELVRIRITFQAEPTGSACAVRLWTADDDDANMPSYAHAVYEFDRPFAAGEWDGKDIDVVGLATEVHKAIMAALAFLVPSGPGEKL